MKSSKLNTKQDLDGEEMLAKLVNDGFIRWKNFGIIRLRKRKAITRVLNGQKIEVPARLIPEFIASKNLKKILWKNK